MPPLHIPRWTHLSSRDGALPTPGPLQQTLCLLIDVDRDGRNDFVIGCRQAAPALTWFRNRPGGWDRHLLDGDLLSIEAGGAFHDIDGDGNLDLVAGEDASGNHLYWWRNPHPRHDPQTPWRRYVIKGEGANKHHDQAFGDVDGDGKPELVFWNQGANRLYLAPVPPDPRVEPWPYFPIWESGTHAEEIALADLNGDGKLEILAGGRWFEHLGGREFAPHGIDDAQRNSRIAAGDLNGDGRLEVVMVPGDGDGPLRWYAPVGDRRRPDAWIAHDLLDRDVRHGHSLAVADINGDGHLDIVCGEMRKWTAADDNSGAKLWLFLGDGRGGFETVEVATGFGVHEARVGDLNGDGRPDILAKPYNWDTPRLDLWLQSPS